MPEQLGDREMDNWRPLVAIADAISKEQGERVRAAAVKFSVEAVDETDAALMCLADVAEIFELNKKETLSTKVILDALNELKERPWPTWRKGQPMGANNLSKQLNPFGIRAKKSIYAAGPVREAKDRYVDQDFKLDRARHHPLLGGTRNDCC